MGESDKGEGGPNLVGMAIVFVGAILFGLLFVPVVSITIFGELFGLSSKVVAVISAIGMLFWLAYSANTIAKTPKYRNGPPVSHHVFHVFQVAAVAICWLGTIATRSSNAEFMKWFSVTMDFFVVIFLASYCGFGFCLGTRVSKSVFVSIALTIASAAFSIYWF